MDESTKQTLIGFGICVIPPIAIWMGLGFPTDRVALGILGSSIAAAVVAWLKELKSLRKK